MDPLVVALSRLQFGATALYHFLFVPLTLGLSLLMAIMESIYVMTGRDVWRRMTQFWAVLFAINFAMGVATGIVMEFQFGTNWSYYSQYVGDIFGAPLAIEGLMAFFLEATFIGLFFFAWDRLSKTAHLAVTWLVALGANLSALWILIANGWMQNPVGAVFNPDTMRMELSDLMAVIFNPVAQDKFVHTVSAGYVTGAVFVMGVSALYMLRGRHMEMAKRSIAVAASFGLASALSVVVLGDESGYTATHTQKMKIAAIEAMWQTEPAPAALNLFAIPDQKDRTNHYEVKVPFLLGLIATRSLSEKIPGIDQLQDEAEYRVRNGIKAYEALEKIRQSPQDRVARQTLSDLHPDLGYGLLLKRYHDDITKASDEDIAKAARDTVPDVGPLFWSFRIMAGIGFYLIAFFVLAFWLVTKNRLVGNRKFLWLAVISLPAPWLAAELGWFLSEFGRQPWIIEGIMPTFYAISGLSVTDLIISLSGFVLLYTVLAVIEAWLMVKAIKTGPETTHGHGVDTTHGASIGADHAIAAPSRNWD
ncbi:MAG: cytochrome ubiquinol oxidase subunit I [Hyphomicrobiales bacterium]